MQWYLLRFTIIGHVGLSGNAGCCPVLGKCAVSNRHRQSLKEVFMILISFTKHMPASDLILANYRIPLCPSHFIIHCNSFIGRCEREPSNKYKYIVEKFKMDEEKSVLTFGTEFIWLRADPAWTFWLIVDLHKNVGDFSACWAAEQLNSLPRGMLLYMLKICNTPVNSMTVRSVDNEAIIIVKLPKGMEESKWLGWILLKSDKSFNLSVNTRRFPYTQLHWI